MCRSSSALSSDLKLKENSGLYATNLRIFPITDIIPSEPSYSMDDAFLGTSSKRKKIIQISVLQLSDTRQ